MGLAAALLVVACARDDRAAAERDLAAATREAKAEARDIQQAAADTARTVSENVRAASAIAGEEVADALLQLKVKAALLDKLGVDGARIAVDARQGHVELYGAVNAKSTAELAEQVALSVDGVATVEPRIAVENDLAGSLIDKQVDRAIGATRAPIADALLETRVKARLIEAMGKAAFAVEVEAADGVVSLSGEVPDEIRRALAVQTAEGTPGVTRVADRLRNAAA
jgi:osmotically-inducible protein OsmY